MHNMKSRISHASSHTSPPPTYIYSHMHIVYMHRYWMWLRCWWRVEVSSIHCIIYIHSTHRNKRSHRLHIVCLLSWRQNMHVSRGSVVNRMYINSYSPPLSSPHRMMTPHASLPTTSIVCLTQASVMMHVSSCCICSHRWSAHMNMWMR